MKDMDLVFWNDEEEEKNNTLKLLLCCNAKENEDWLKDQLPDFEEAGRASNLTEIKKVLKANEYINLAIILRKTGGNGVDKPEELARLIREHSPDAQIFIIVGKKDERGMEILEKTIPLKCETLVAENGPIKAIDILQVVNNLADVARVKFSQKQVEETVENDKLKVIFIEGVKGGCGETTILTIIGQMLKNANEAVAIIDSSNGMLHLNHTLQDCLITKNQIPEKGWLLLDKRLIDIEQEHDLYHFIVSDSSSEGLYRAKQKVSKDNYIIINRAEPSILPNEVYKGEFKREPDLIVTYRPTPYYLLDWDELYKEWQPIVDLLLKR